jgi:hypothetical protein
MAQAPNLLIGPINEHLGTAGPLLRAPVNEAASRGAGVCNGQSDVELTGVYDSVVIEDCPRVTLDQVHTGSLVIRRSTASIMRSTFSAGIVADASTLIVTGGAIGGEVALDVKDSKVDLAGVAITASREPFRATGQSRVLLSVCPVRNAGGLGYRHGFVNLTPPAP